MFLVAVKLAIILVIFHCFPISIFHFPFYWDWILKIVKLKCVTSVTRLRHVKKKQNGNNMNGKKIILTSTPPTSFLQWILTRITPCSLPRRLSASIQSAPYITHVHDISSTRFCWQPVSLDGRDGSWMYSWELQRHTRELQQFRPSSWFLVTNHRKTLDLSLSRTCPLTPTYEMISLLW